MLLHIFNKAQPVNQEINARKYINNVMSKPTIDFDVTLLVLLILSHCVKSVQIRSNFWSVFSHIRTEYGPEITPYLDTFHAVSITLNVSGIR